MFNLLGKATDMAINTVTSPIRVAGDTLDIIGGLTVGQIRTKAIASLGTEIASGMTQTELIEWYKGS